VPSVGPKGFTTKVIPAHYADLLVRRELAKELPKPRRAAKAAAPVEASTPKPPPDVPLTSKELKAKLKALGVKIPFGAKRSALIALYDEAVKDA
jgi:hypothetical protein